MVGVPVVAVGGVHRDAGAFLGLVAGTGAGGVGVHLEGEGRLRGQVLEQVGQAGAEAGGGLGAEDAVRVVGDQGGEGSGAVLAVHGAGGAVVGPQPEFGLGSAVGLDPQQVWDGGARSPGVRSYLVGEPVHPLPAFQSVFSHPVDTLVRWEQSGEETFSGRHGTPHSSR